MYHHCFEANSYGSQQRHFYFLRLSLVQPSCGLALERFPLSPKLPPIPLLPAYQQQLSPRCHSELYSSSSCLLLHTSYACWWSHRFPANKFCTFSSRHPFVQSVNETRARTNDISSFNRQLNEMIACIHLHVVQFAYGFPQFAWICIKKVNLMRTANIAQPARQIIRI